MTADAIPPAGGRPRGAVARVAGGGTGSPVATGAPDERVGSSGTRLVAAGLLVAAVGALGAVASGGSTTASGDDGVLGPGRATVELGIEHSTFSTNRIVVERGTVLTFVVDNSDPIGHELIVGPPEVHARHEAGTEAAHPAVPGEVTVPALTAADTTYAFDDVGTSTFACHLPGHVAYGMVGEVVVVD